jgi:uncharacterized protein (TIGR03067 family)
MNRRLLLFPVLACIAAANFVQTDDAKKELKQLEGTWKIVSGEKGGKPAPPGELDALRLIFSGDKLTVQISAGGKEDKKVASLKIDPTKKPKHLDITPDDGPEKGKTMSGIYQMDGKNLKLCLNEGGQERPTEFASPEASRIMILVLERLKSDDKEGK